MRGEARRTLKAFTPWITTETAITCQDHLRKLQMDVDKKELEVQKAQQDLDRYVLDLEHKYGLMGQENTIDPRTATIEAPLPTRIGKVQTEELLNNGGKQPHSLKGTDTGLRPTPEGKPRDLTHILKEAEKHA